jgi:protein TonB
VLGASLWSVDEPPDPPVPITWVSTAPPAPAPLPRSGASPRQPARPKGERRAVAAPSAVPDRLPIAATLPEPAATVESGEETSGAADDGADSTDGGPGIPGGWGPGGVGPGVESRDGILVPGGDVRAPVLRRRIEPAYPEIERKARREGDVVLEAIIASGGEIEEVRIVKSAGPLFDASATAAVSSWTYRPATLNGRAVRVLLTVTISFRLH